MRPTDANDLDALRVFLSRAFGVGLEAPFLDPAVMRWKFWECRDDWDQPRSYVLEREGLIVAHAGVWPVLFVDGESVTRGVHLIDWAASKESAGAGVALMKKLSSMFDFMYAIGGSEATRRVLPAFGFVDYAQQWRAVRPLRPLRQMITHQNRDWKLLPRLARNWMWAARGGPVGDGASLARNWRSNQIAPRQLTAGPAWMAGSAALSSPRTPGFFEYLSRCPAIRFSLYEVLEGEQRRGHFALGVLRGQARVTGVWLDEPTEDNLAATFFLAQRAALEIPGAVEVVAAGSEPGPARAAVQRAGFQTMPGAKISLLDRQKKLSLPPEFQFQLCDDDAAFLDPGTTAYWS